MWRIGLLLDLLLKLPQTLLDLHLESLIGPLLAFVIPLLQLSVLVLQFLDFILLDAHDDVFLFQVLFEEDVVNFIALLDHYQVIVGVGQLTDIVLKLYKFLLHGLLILGQILLSLPPLLLLILVIRHQLLVLLALLELELSLRRYKVKHPLIIRNLLQLFYQIFSSHLGSSILEGGL